MIRVSTDSCYPKRVITFSVVIEFGYNIINESSSSETIAYTLSTSRNGSGYYSFIFPFTCSLQPVLYVGIHARNLDDSLIENWVSKTKGLSQPCSGSDIDVRVIGFTNALYDRISLEYPSSSSPPVSSG